MQIVANTLPQPGNPNGKSYLMGEGLPCAKNAYKTEHWRMTPIRYLADRTYQLVQKSQVDALLVQQVIDAHLALWSIRLDRLIVLVDGEYSAHFSGYAALVQKRDLPSTDLVRLPFAGQNLAVSDQVICLSFDQSSDEPLHLLCLHSCQAEAASFARVHIEVQQGVSVDLVEVHQSLLGRETKNASSDYTYYSNSLIYANLAKESSLGHYKWQNLSEKTLHIASHQVTLAEAAHYDGFVLNMGGQMVRQDVEMMINGSHANGGINGAYIGHHQQHIDNTSQIQHIAPNSYSREVFKGVLSDQARGVFQARIHVHQAAQLTDAYQMNRALLLSTEAEVNAKPELEIYADDVKCSHGATVGALDADQLFYLRARGIAHADATVMLIEAYLEDLFADIVNQDVALKFAQSARAKLHSMAITSCLAMES